MEVGQSGQIDDILAVDSREHPHGLALQCEAKENQERFEDGLEFWYFTRLGRLVKEPAGVGSDREIFLDTILDAY